MGDNTNKFLIGCIGLTCITIVGLALLFLIIAALTYIVCLGFGIEWSWLVAAAVLALMILFAIAAAVIG